MLHTHNFIIKHKAGLLNDRVQPLCEAQGLPMLRILTDRGTECCGKVERHDYQLYPAINDIDHTKTKAMSPQTNGICERFHKTICRVFIRLRSARRYTGARKACGQIRISGCGMTIMSELIREKCSAGEHQWPGYLMENGSGQKRIWTRCNLTDNCISNQ
ncbi:Integrase catalytic subunit [Erwinia tracheiphila PSU-1]|nr:Integrase catalytic subunit [Erwinia tracheiphila PSU-1]